MKITLPIDPHLTQLPDKPSELIRVALEDFKAVTAMKDVGINLYTWVRRGKGGKGCEVCLAGAVMLQRFSYSDIDTPYETLSPVQFGETNCHKLRAINYFRIGCMREALRELKLVLPHGVFAPYSFPVDPRTHFEDFVKYMGEMADWLTSNNM